MIDVIFNSYKIKFIVMDELLSSNKVYVPRMSEANIFINIEPILSKLASANVDEYLRVKDEKVIFEVISDIINLASHYRLYCTKCGWNGKIYMYMQYPFRMHKMKNKSLISDYRDNYEYRFSKHPTTAVLCNIIFKAMPFTKLIFEYLNGVYFVVSDVVENSLIPYIINSENNTANNFMVTTNPYDYQYVNHGFNILRPKGENSYLITKDNAIDYICSTNNITTIPKVTPVSIPFINSIVGNKLRNIPGVKGIGYKKIFNMMNKAIDKNIITPQTNNINILMSMVSDKFTETVLKNFYCTDIDYQYKVLGTKDKYDITSQLVDRYDVESLRKLNDKYFSEYPINLVEVTSSVQQKKNIMF